MQHDAKELAVLATSLMKVIRQQLEKCAAYFQVSLNLKNLPVLALLSRYLNGIMVQAVHNTPYNAWCHIANMKIYVHE